MNCEQARDHLLDHARRRLDPATQAELGAHLEVCETCRGEERSELALDALLQDKLPRYTAPLALKRRLGLRLGTPEASRPSSRRWARVLAPALAACVAFVAGGAVVQRLATERSALEGLTSEVVNDHLRVLASQHPLDVESGGQHQVKPWFEGKLDFAPAVPALEGGELRLRGGSVGYVFDRKAAVLVYALRLHVVTLLAFRADGLPWPERGTTAVGPARGRAASSRGFNVVLWRDGELGYVLVSDVNASELSEVAGRLAAATARPAGP
ncbi:MAG TPA: zf-HC2 domain-containing protein [Anaeromyxobacteraceae bacterium]|nr:zf-HC2 domain-containing protein [Anaeromyxobacteraceae bacterium]